MQEQERREAREALEAKAKKEEAAKYEPPQTAIVVQNANSKSA